MPQRRRLFTLELGGRTSTLSESKRHPGRYRLDVNGVPQSIISAGDPTRLQYAYIRHIARAIDAAAPNGDPLFTVHLGAGALTLPRYVDATRPGSAQLVVEFEPALYAAVVTAVPLSPGTQLRAIFGDARAVADADLADSDDAPGHEHLLSGPGEGTALIRTAPDTAWSGAHFTVVDLWDAALIHRRVASLEFYRRVAARSARDGVIAVNLLDGHPFEYSRRQAATLGAIFEHVAVVLDAEPEDDEGPLGNVLVFASHRPLAIAERPTLLGEPVPHLLCGPELTAWIDDAAVMTDSDGTDSPDPDDPRWE